MLSFETIVKLFSFHPVSFCHQSYYNLRSIFSTDIQFQLKDVLQTGRKNYEQFDVTFYNVLHCSKSRKRPTTNAG